MKKLFSIFLIALLYSPSCFAHNKGQSYEVKTIHYNCYLMGKGFTNFQFYGGDGKFGSEEGSFKGGFRNEEVDKTEKYKLIIHGDRDNGGNIKVYYPSGRLMNYATILPNYKLKEMPHSTLNNKNNIEDQILWLSAFRTNYKVSTFMTFVRNTLRMKTFGNSPTNAVGIGQDFFFDCKSEK